MSVQVFRNPLFAEVWLATALLLVLVLAGGDWHAAWAEVYKIHGQGQKLIYSNAPVVSSPSADIEGLGVGSNSSKLVRGAGNKGIQSNTETVQHKEGSGAQERTVEMEQESSSGNSSAGTKVKTRTRSDFSKLRPEGGI